MKPKIFVSSTIIDFEDLRSALKYYLEEFGYDVQMSEYPDFNIDTDASVFDACIKNLEKCQYFILLIGYRRGSWYISNKMSITHKEYLSAKELIENGNPLRIIAFVRKPIWLLKNDREALIQHFNKKSSEISKEINKIGSSVIDDPEYTFNFIHNVSQGIIFPGSDSPANNWMFDFESFEDIIIALRHIFGISQSLEEKKLKRLFIEELKRNRFKFMVPLKGIKIEDYDDIQNIPQEYYLENLAKLFFPRLFDSEGNLLIGKKELIISGKEFINLLKLSFLFPTQKNLKNFNTRILEKVLNEGSYLTFSVYKNDFDPNFIHFAIEKLFEWIKNITSFFETEIYDGFQKEIINKSIDGSAHLPSLTLSMYTAGTIFSLASGFRIKELIDCILEILENSNYDPLSKFDFSDQFYLKYTRSK